jgi:hypothetical protein
LEWQLASQLNQAKRKRLDKLIDKEIQSYLENCDQLQLNDDSDTPTEPCSDPDHQHFDMLQKPFHQAEADCFIISNALSLVGRYADDARALAKLERTISGMQKTINLLLPHLRRMLYLIGDVSVEALLGRANLARKYRERRLAFQTVKETEGLGIEIY